MKMSKLTFAVIFLIIFLACKKENNNPNSTKGQAPVPVLPVGKKRIKSERITYSSGTYSTVSVKNYYYDGSQKLKRIVYTDSSFNGSWSFSISRRTITYNGINRFYQYFDTSNTSSASKVTWYYDNNNLIKYQHNYQPGFSNDSTIFIHSGNKFIAQLKNQPPLGSPKSYYTDGNLDSIVNFYNNQPTSKFVYLYNNNPDLRYMYFSSNHPFQPSYKQITAFKQYDNNGNLISTTNYYYQLDKDKHPKIITMVNASELQVNTITYY